MSMIIQPVFGPYAPEAPASVNGPAAVRQSEEEQSPARTPVVDEYIPEEVQEPTGRYWLGKDEDGQPRIYFDDPEKGGAKPETCTGNTDAVDREIERLRQKKSDLEQQISSAADDAEVKALERELAQVERELSQKDTDAYRRRHTVFS